MAVIDKKELAESDDLIDCIELYVPIVIPLRWDVLPFGILYLCSFCFMILGNPIIRITGFILTPCILVSQIVLFLFAQWSASFRVKLGCRRSYDVNNAALVLVHAAKNAGADKIVQLFERVSVTGSQHEDILIIGKKHVLQAKIFEFQNVKYGYSSLTGVFERLTYPESGLVSDFLSSKGHSTESFQGSFFKWGANEFDIPVPGFLDLYLEHLIAPFFVFQVVCLFLWSLDDYWYYSVFTLLMLMFFEGVLCRQRQNSVLMLRNMRRPPVEMYAYRANTWMVISSEEIVPGDIISLNSNRTEKDELIVPCDALVLRGNCVINEAMLTGESVPQAKDCLNCCDNKKSAIQIGGNSIAEASWRRYLVFSGTALMQHSQITEEEKLSNQDGNLSIPFSPDGGCTAFVMRTAFGTSQGSLVRKILFATERINLNAMETFHFIAFLVVFAAIASSRVLYVGVQDENRNKFRLALHCIMIITSVIPPELPMELSLAVTNSLASLSRSLVFCTEPFRISYAGKLDVVCFDKTGTISKDLLTLRGLSCPITQSFSDISLRDDGSAINYLQDDAVEEGSIVTPQSCSDISLVIMSVCQSLFIANGVITGDPLDLAAMKASGLLMNQSTSGVTFIRESADITWRIVFRYPFSSSLKRMSVVAEKLNAENSSKGRVIFVFTKGAPEVLGDKLKTIPSNYHKVYKYHMSQGKRVIALAFKALSGEQSSAVEKSKLNRDTVESDLIFAGFLVFDCDLKADSKSVIKELKESSHKVAMITGDSAYTAVDVARRVGILRFKSTSKMCKTLILRQITTSTNSSAENRSSLVWRAANEDDSSDRHGNDVDFKVSRISSLYLNFDLCVTGPALEFLVNVFPENGIDSLKHLCPSVTIFARVSPEQKELVIRSLNECGMFTLMCGDGTNDVGALKAAHVGVSIVNDPELESKIEDSAKSSQGPDKKNAKQSSSKDRLARAMSEYSEQEKDPTIIKLGDASIASSFTARRTSIDSVLTVIRQGRCTLVTTIQVYKILALNCLVSAYMMSALYLRGLKQGDVQMTAVGLVTAGLFFFLSQAQPLLHITDQRPPMSVFSKSVIISIGGQFLIHLVSLISTLALCESYISQDDNALAPDGRFQPNIVNSAVFILTSAMQVNNFVINYRGHPFTQSIRENLYLWRSVQIIYLALIVITGGQVLPLNDLLQMSPFPSANFQIGLLSILGLNFGCSYLIESFSHKFE